MKICLEVYGCTANKSDASLIMGLLKKNSYETVKNLEDADVLLILTCTVISTTEQRMLSRLRIFKKTGKKVIHFNNNSGTLDNLIRFLEDIQKKIDYLNLNVSVEGKSIKITLFGSRDLQYLATERLKDLANRYL